MGQGLEFSLPSLAALSFLPFIFLQGCLLHPSIPNHISRPLRILLVIPGVYLSFIAPFKWRIEPVVHGVGANFRWGIFGPNFIMKAIEWGFAKDRSVYTWIGFDEAEELETQAARVIGALNGGKVANGHSTANGHSNGNGNVTLQKRSLGKLEGAGSSTTSLDPDPHEPTRPDGSTKLVPADVGKTGAPAVVKNAQTSAAKRKDGPVKIFFWTVHLLASMRGIGYAWGPPPHSLGKRPPRDPFAFFLFALRQFITAHIAATICLIIIIHQKTTLPLVLHTYLFPFLSPPQLQPLADVLAYLSVGISLGFQMLVGFYGVALICLLLTISLRAILPEGFRPAPFDSREYPPFFVKPHLPKSVTVFWARQWHHLFRKPFTAVGYEPVGTVVAKIAGKPIGRAAGAVAVFGLSAWMHDQGLWSARSNLPGVKWPALSFSERWGGCIFFLVQAAAVILEGFFTRATGKKVGGLWGRLWSYFCIVGIGMLAGRSWIALGLVEGLPTIDHWKWQRWVVPSSALAPPPLWTT